MSICPMIGEQVMIIVTTSHSRALAACDMQKVKCLSKINCERITFILRRSIDSSLSVKSYHGQVSVLGEQLSVYLLVYFLLAFRCIW